MTLCLATPLFPSTTHTLAEEAVRSLEASLIVARRMHAEQLVNQALEQLGAVSSAHELMTQYARRGSEVPMIYGEPRIAFHAYQCAREKANAMFAPPT